MRALASIAGMWEASPTCLDFLMSPVICQSKLPFAPWMDLMANRLPGLQPVAPGDWLQRDDAFAGQMACRDRLLATQRADVYEAMPGSEPAAHELLGLVAATVLASPGYGREAGGVRRPDGVVVPLDGDPPLVVAARLVQEDLLILQPGGEGPVLTAAVAAFPASWTLREKIGRPLAAIHAPVERYDPRLAERVDKLIANLKPDAPVWRANVLRYNDPDLFHPRPLANPRPFDPAGPVYVRMERQTLRRLTHGDAVVFTIHTWMVPHAALSPQEATALDAYAPPRFAGA